MFRDISVIHLDTTKPTLIVQLNRRTVIEPWLEAHERYRLTKYFFSPHALGDTSVATNSTHHITPSHSEGVLSANDSWIAKAKMVRRPTRRREPS